jgi:hypothetical protein
VLLGVVAIFLLCYDCTIVADYDCTIWFGFIKSDFQKKKIFLLCCNYWKIPIHPILGIYCLGSLGGISKLIGVSL